jgi:hypothetical protein
MIVNFTTNTALQQMGSLAWLVDSGLGIQMGAGDLTFFSGTSSAFFTSGWATPTDQYASSSGLNIFGQAGRTDFSIGRLEAYAVTGPVVCPNHQRSIASVGACLGFCWRRRRKTSNVSAELSPAAVIVAGWLSMSLQPAR